MNEALLAFVEAVEKDTDGVWIDYVEAEGAVDVLLIGNCDLPAIAEAYVNACRALGRAIKAEAPHGGGHIEPAEAARLVELPRRK